MGTDLSMSDEELAGSAGRGRLRPALMAVAALVLIGGAAGAVFLSGPRTAAAQATAPAPVEAPAAAEVPAQPWQVNCSSAGANERMVCQMSQTIVRATAVSASSPP